MGQNALLFNLSVKRGLYKMNLVILKGNITRDIELIFAPGSGLAVAKFGLAVARMKKEDGADFINCVAFGKQAELIAESLHKGSPILIEGRIQTGSYENKEGKKVYTTDIVINKFEFIGKKEDNNSTPSESNFEEKSFNEEMTPVDDGDIPF
jgi:single-strand DNA-binding protein